MLYDYLMLCSAGCRLYAIYSRSDLSGCWSTDVSILSPAPCDCCANADVDGNGVANLADAVAYLAARVEASPLADIDRNYTLDSGDDAAFFTALSQAQGPP